MFKRKITDQIIESPERIRIDPSRCSRMRYSENTCERCLKSCEAGAISTENGLTINQNACAECMLCVSECLSGAFQIVPLNFSFMIARLRKVPSPAVISCGIKPDQSSHEKTVCLGFLSEEHILGLLVFLPGKLQLNLTECATCRNGFIVSVLRKRLDSVEARTSMRAFERIRLVEKKAVLDYKDISYDRRGFFKALKNLSAQKTASLLDNNNASKPAEAYSSKILPVKRKLLNRILPVVSGKVYQGLLKNYYYHVTVDESCDYCFACGAMCPTGALKQGGQDSDERLFFNTSLCNGCGLCVDFCRNHSLLIKEGFFGPTPFEFIRLTGKQTQHLHADPSLSLNSLSGHSC